MTDIVKKNNQDRCLPWVNDNETTPLKANTIVVIIRILVWTFTFGFDKTYNMAANPNQARVVKAQANIKTRLVNQSLPSNLGKSSRRNKRINMYFPLERNG